MGSNVKIALSLSGKPTCSMLCFPYIYDAFLNTQHKVDVFVHTWEKSRVLDLYNPVKFEIEALTQAQVVRLFMLQTKLPQGCSIEGGIEANILQYYTLKKSFDLIPDDYDIVIRCRFDVILQDKFNLDKVVSQITNNEYDVYCPDKIFNFGGYQDRIYIGNYRSMKIATSIIEEINNLARTLNKWHPESFLAELLNSNGIRVYQEDINHRLVRNVNITTNWPEAPYTFFNL